MKIKRIRLGARIKKTEYDDELRQDSDQIRTKDSAGILERCEGEYISIYYTDSKCYHHLSIHTSIL